MPILCSSPECRADFSQPPTQNSPAEQRLSELRSDNLLRCVLPPDLYDEYSRTGGFTVHGKIYRYRLSRENRTRAYSSERSSCGRCIQFQYRDDVPNTSLAYQQDRLVMEYLLITCAEGEYLRLANAV